MQMLRADDLTSTYGEKTLFDHISFLIKEHDRIGLIGVNGSGKTSLLNVISGHTSAEEGNIDHPHDYTIGYLEQQPPLDPEKRIIDAVLAGGQPLFRLIRQYENLVGNFSGTTEENDRLAVLQRQMDQQDAWEVQSRVETVLTQLKIKDMGVKIGEMSGGQQKRVGLAQVLIQQPDLLLLDEPTNQLDIDSIVWLQDYLAKYRGAVMIVTHDRYFLDQVANQIWELSFGKLYKYDGNYQDYVAEKAAREERETTAEHKRQQLYKHELAWMKKGAKARSTKQKGRINRFHELSQTVGTLRTEDKLDIGLGSTRLGHDVLELKDASLKVGSHNIFQHFNLLIEAGERLGISGNNGAGKSSLLNVLAGRLPLDGGTLKVGETVKIGYYTQQTEPIDEDKRVINYLSEVAETIYDDQGQKISVTQLLERFLFPRFMHGTLIRKLSGGEKRRLYLLKILMQQPNVLLLDEPTNDLDISTLTVLEDYLDHFAGTVITVSHDRYFLDKVADQLLIFQGNGQIQPATGLFTDYLKNAADQLSRQQKPQQKTKQKQAKLQSTKAAKHKLTYKEQVEWRGLEPAIEKLDQRSSELNDEMAANGDNYEKLAELQKELDEVNAENDRKMARWEYLSQFVDDDKI
ncbi:MAG: ABC-F family ATP-binding cassette domain-containing protein [[Lactobacillus] timonensis]|jgi:ATP-binding cassette subfamily F protein uup|uniref:ABC-F family ATP-binding cassette domain-containing protein n=1 Tax=[Lactobacillus] timonensis TaxID=1970790 RepID=UPI0023545FDB|nr:ABC-F family ATP-binding cassette domain-containing protein [[Lactobacillus] timonensis]MCI1925580.1 ABC-F family ATP-binding cassette domain-containing protein [[Lactobacillus] timonensis]MCI1956938.1 ABC-F family ATP-binding cassette domain-containing protein [[Lactobacillus] timonensis]MCI1969928.1 ABC-F family ATP-binding cassette domain-containing protein [[Lactobacillus] timonensis]MCI2006129.1 ABC-F family ATP-binding cassette domain-containing protein [[Lactobacillus] timonensis]